MILSLIFQSIVKAIRANDKIDVNCSLTYEYGFKMKQKKKKLYSLRLKS